MHDCNQQGKQANQDMRSHRGCLFRLARFAEVLSEDPDDESTIEGTADVRNRDLNGALQDAMLRTATGRARDTAKRFDDGI